jgi:carboxyl-terminal processing protease
MKRQNFLLWSFLFLATFALGWQIGEQVERQRHVAEQAAIEAHFSLAGSGVTFTEDPEKEVRMDLLWAVWRLLDRNYVDPDALTIDQLRFGAVRGLVEALKDPYSAFMTPKENTDFQDTLGGKLEGIGAELTMRGGNVVVVAPLKGAPASRAGLLPQDVILKVDGESMENMNLQDAVMRIRGEKGTTVVLSVFRPSLSNQVEIAIVRDEIHVPSVEYERIETGSGSVGYLALNQFGDETVKEARKAIRELPLDTLDGMILDLRFNGGGYLDGAIEVASFFLGTEKIVSVHRRGEEISSHFALGHPLVTNIPLVVLINEGSASASEIVAGALRDTKRATIMGTRSFGKGTVQEVIDLPGGSSLRVTVAKWKTPNGSDISADGIVPDMLIPMDMKEFTAGNDTQKAAALEYLLDGEIDIDAYAYHPAPEDE